ncbi:matrix protein [Raspberry vein chlorosis virus]|uniref:Matrix protein n=1 Tax=Raspberry vein chlorosis virus TaxID=758677 RepID=A0A482PB87_9RHAB|nr:matrix protein [Raspberry vein chlorosis virus]QBS46633.1 matrix protein [Raspberry vein chlorosis virus]
MEQKMTTEEVAVKDRDSKGLMFWRGISIQYKYASLDFKKGVSPIKLTHNGEISSAIGSLLLGAGGSKHVINILRSMIDHKHARNFVDYYTSPLLGPKTQRLNFAFPKFVVVPFPANIPCGREKLTAIGKKGKIGGREVISAFDIDVVITDIEPGKIKTLLVETPGWFIGELELPFCPLETEISAAGPSIVQTMVDGVKKLG